jgi:hypothetical protein
MTQEEEQKFMQISKKGLTEQVPEKFCQKSHKLM